MNFSTSKINLYLQITLSRRYHTPQPPHQNALKVKYLHICMNKSAKCPTDFRRLTTEGIAFQQQQGLLCKSAL